jgi:hypothetical protein
MYSSSHDGPHRLGTDELVELASKLRAADTGEWAEPALRELVAGLGWTWSDGADGPDLATGLTTRSATLNYVARPPIAVPEGYFGLHVPVAISEDSVAAKVADFRWATDVLSEAFGTSSLLGSYGQLMPFDAKPPSWGSPFRRWRGRPDSLELRASESGVELLIHSTNMIEDWLHVEDSALEGFFGYRNVKENDGLSIPAGHEQEDWESLHDSLSRFLSPLAAELTALGIEPSLCVGAYNPGPLGAEISITVVVRESKLTLDCEVYYPSDADVEGRARLADTVAALGWNPVDDLSTSSFDSYTEFASDEFDQGEVDGGRRLARLVVDTYHRIGVPSVEHKYVSLGDRTGLGESFPGSGDYEYEVSWMGLGLSIGD